MRLFVLLATLLAAPYANAECRWHTETDNVTQQTYEMIICTGDNAELLVTCADRIITLSILSEDFIGGDTTRAYVRGDVQENAATYTARVFNSGTGFTVDIHRALEVVDTFIESNEVYFRYSNYRDVPMDATIYASGFAALTDRLACVEQARERLANPESGVVVPTCGDECDEITIKDKP